MRFKTKVAILMVAVFLSFAGFNMVASVVAPDLLKAKNEALNDAHSRVLAKSETAALHSNLIKG